MFNQRIHGSKRSLRSVEDFTQFEQRTAYFNGDHVSAQRKGMNRPDRGQRGDVLPLAARVWRAEERPGETSQGAGDGEHPAAAGSVGPDAGQADPAGGGAGKLLSPQRRLA